MKIMALDYGDSTIGVAISDDLLLTAQGRDTIIRESLKKDLDIIISYIVDENVDIVVLGLPKNMNGTLGERANKTMDFAKKLKKKLMYSERVKDKKVEIDFWDERLTSVAAEKMLISASVRRDKRKKVIDKIAAIYILEGYLGKINMERGQNE